MMRKFLIWGAAGVALFGLGLFLFGRNYTLTCTRSESGHVTCSRSAWVLGIKLGEETVDGVTGADVSYSSGEYGGYKVVLRTTSGRTVGLTPMSTSGPGIREARMETATEINAFIADRARKTLELNTGIGLVGTVFVLVSLYLAIRLVIKATKEPGGN